MDPGGTHGDDGTQEGTEQGPAVSSTASEKDVAGLKGQAPADIALRALRLCNIYSSTVFEWERRRSSASQAQNRR